MASSGLRDRNSLAGRVCLRAWGPGEPRWGGRRNGAALATDMGARSDRDRDQEVDQDQDEDEEVRSGPGSSAVSRLCPEL